MSDKIMCQAKDGDSGADGIAPADAEALQAKYNADAERAKALNYRDAYGAVVARLIDWFSVSPDEQDSFAFEDYQAIMMDAGLMNDDHELTKPAKDLLVTIPYLAANTQSQIEERSDEVGSASTSASLTHIQQDFRNSIIEQCAKLIDEQAYEAFDTSTHSRDAMTIHAYNTLCSAFHAAAKELRSLKSQKEPANDQDPRPDRLRSACSVSWP